jgi:5-methylcytosine-specific restriction endonuclease McrA
MSTNRRRKDSGWVDPKKLPKGPNGHALCRYCSTEVKPPRRTFCSDSCVHEWKLRSSPKYVRQCLKKRDKGICAKCGIDTYKLSKGLRKPLKGESWEVWQERVKKIREEWKIGPGRVTLWEFDHITAVVENGGETGLQNAQTLCVKCHRQKSAELVSRLAAERRANKKSGL